MVSRADCRHRGPGIKSHKERKLFGGGGEGAERAGAVGGGGNYLGGGDIVGGEEDCCQKLFFIQILNYTRNFTYFFIKIFENQKM